MKLRKIFLILSFLIGLSISLPTPQCPDGWLPRPGSNYCYRFYDHIQLDWDQAKVHCETSESILVTIEDQKEKVYIGEHSTSSRYLIGLRQTKQGQDPTDNWKWLNGKQLDSQSAVTWKKGQPSKDAWTSGHICGALDSDEAKLSAVSCTGYQYNFICKRDVNLPLFCPMGWSLVNDRCYKLFIEDRGSFFYASNQCVEKGGQLLVVQTREEAQLVIDVMLNVKEYRCWIGLKKEAGENSTWEWQIPDGKNQTGLDPSLYWGNGEPYMANPDSEYCAESWAYDQQWHSVPCGADTAYICERPKGGCVSGWQEYKGKCYQVNDDWESHIDWWSAHQFCQRQNAGLVKIENATENRFLWELGASFYWIGISDCQQFNVSAPNADCTNVDHSSMMWYDSGDKVEDGYSNFYTDRKYMNQDPAACGYIDWFDGKWDTWDCQYGNHFFCEVAVGTQVISPNNGTFEEFFCPLGWSQHGQFCYKFAYEKVAWTEAKESCTKEQTNNDAYLVSIIHPEEESFITENMRDNYWIGLNDRNEEGRYEWSDSVKTTLGVYTNWNTDEPKSGHDVNCVVASSEQINNDYQSKWNVTQCGYRFGFACKMEAYSSSTDTGKTTTEWPAQCGPYWRFEPVTGYCYRISEEYTTWSDGEQSCRDMEGHLASIHSTAEMTVITEYVKQINTQVWFGANDRDVHGGWKNSDGTPFNYVHWSDGEPNNWESDEHCAEIQNGQMAGLWNDIKCTNRRRYLCKKWGGGETTRTTVTLPQSSMPGDVYGCAHDWEPFLLFCYKVITKTKSQPDALKDCRKSGADLASIHSSVENSFIEVITKDMGSYRKLWIGLHDVTTNGVYSWTDGTSVDYTNWNLNEPNDWGGIEEEDCVEYFLDWSVTGMWNDIHCRYSRAYICKMQKSWMPAPTGPVTESGCPVGYKAYGTSCYLFSEDQQSWNDSKSACNLVAPGASLIHVNDIQEQAFLASQLGQKNNKYWIGTFYEKTSNRYKYDDGASITFTNWDQHYPDENQGKCVSATSGLTAGLWQNVECITDLNYICEIPRLGVTTTTPTPSTTPSPEEQCPDETWQKYMDSGKCFKVFAFQTGPDQNTWSEAENVCLKLGANLATIPDESTNNFLLNTVTAKIPDYMEDGYWIGLNSLSGSEQWVDGSPLVYDNWGSGQPQHGHNNDRQCVIFQRNSGGTWFETNCAQTRNWICEIPLGAKVSTTPSYSTTQPPQCQFTDESCFYDSDICYCIGGGNNWFDVKTWHDAEQTCIDKGQKAGRYGHLMAIHSQNLQNQLITFMQRTGYFGSRFYIGLNELLSYDGSFQWSDGSQLDFTFWAAGEPNDAGNLGEGCVEIYQGTGEWNDLHCSTWQPYLCQYATHLPTDVPTPTPATGNCPAGWIRGSTKCYKFVNTYYSDWSHTRDCYCKGSLPGCEYYAVGGINPDIASIDGGETQLNLLIGMMGLEVGRYWIGLSDSDSPYEYRWADQMPFTYSNWAQNEPYTGSEMEKHCVIMTVSHGPDAGKWETADCLDPYYAQGGICESDPSPDFHPLEPPSGCQSNYTNFGENCYTITGSAASFEEAEAQCQQMGQFTHLASVMNVQEEAFIRNWLHNDGLTSVWIGMTDRKSSGSYEWIDGWPVLFTNWGSLQPSKNEGEGCVVSSERKEVWYDWRGAWQDSFCNATLYGICKYSTGLKPTAEPTSCPDMMCPPVKNGIHWIDGGGCSCYYYQNDKVTQLEAHKNCLQLEADLTSIHTDGEDSFIQTHILSSMTTAPWIGLLASKATDGGFIWTDGTAVDYKNWAFQEPNNHQNAEDCVQIYNGRYEFGKWNDLFCDQQLGFICKTSKVPRPTDAIPPWNVDGYCGKTQDWMLHGNQCYYVSKDWWDSKTWQDAEDSCYQQGGHLLSIHTKDEADFVKNIFYHPNSPYYIWRQQHYWIGLNELEIRGDWQWSDGTILDYVNWAKNEPNDAFGAESCVEWWGNDDGTWNDDHCSAQKMFMCKQPNGTMPTTSPTTLPMGGCPDGWVQNKLSRQCYQWHRETVNWTTAMGNCRTSGNGAELVSIHDATEQAFLVAWMAYAEYNAWIGLNNRRDSYQYSWVDESSFDFQNWDANEPIDPFNGQANCVIVTNDVITAGKWRAISCTGTNGYICAMNEDPSLPTSSPPASSNCTGYYSIYNDACYELLPDSGPGLTWPLGEEKCRSAMNGHLMSVTNIYESNFLTYFIELEHIRSSDAVWIGLRRNGSDIFRWSDGWPVQYTNWGNNQPDGGNDTCVVAKGSDGTWDDTACTRSYKVICKRSKLKPPSHTTTKPGNCPISKNSKYPFMDAGSEDCYMIVFDQLLTWGEAQLQCLLNGGQLASFHSENDISFVLDYMYLQSHGPAWIGLIRKPNGGWQWTDGTGFDLDYWGRNAPYPDNKTTHYDCVRMDDSSGRWYNDDCKGIKPYVCKTPKNPPTTTPIIGTTTPKNPFVTRTPEHTNANNVLGIGSSGIIGIILAFFTGIALVAVVLLFVQQRRNNKNNDDVSDKKTDVSSPAAAESGNAFENETYAEDDF